MPKQLTQDQIIARARQAHGARYDYAKVRYTTFHAPITVTCSIHGDFEQLASNHTLGHGCPRCAAIQRGIDRIDSEWSDEQVATLTKVAASSSLVACAKAVGRDARTVKNKLRKLGLSAKAAKNPLYEIVPGYIWTHLLHSARVRDIPVKISVKDIERAYLAQDKRCALSGWDVTFSSRPKDTTASVDRIDSKKGYTKRNIQIVHKQLNRNKMDSDEDVFYAVCKAVYCNKRDQFEPRVTEWEWDVMNDTERPVQRRASCEA